MSSTHWDALNRLCPILSSQPHSNHMESQTFNNQYALVTSSPQQKPKQSKQMLGQSEQIPATVLYQTLPSPGLSENLDDKDTGGAKVLG